MNKKKILLRVVFSVSVYLGTAAFCFLIGAIIGANGFGDFCLPSGCGYEAGAPIGFYAGLILGLIPVVFINKSDLFE